MLYAWQFAAGESGVNTFTLNVFQSVGSETIAELVLLSGEDASGRFGIQARHANFMTVLSSGLVKLTFTDQHTEFLAVPGGLLHVQESVATLHTRRCWRGVDAAQMDSLLRQDLEAASRSLHNIKSNLAQIEDTMLRRLMQLERER